MNENEHLLNSFTAYCKANPSQRFWQAIRNWSESNFIFVSDTPEGPRMDTFYCKGRTGFHTTPDD